jgi:peptidyl-dipeptidase Dcp
MAQSTSTCNGFVGKSATPAVAKAKIEAKAIQDLSILKAGFKLEPWD